MGQTVPTEATRHSGLECLSTRRTLARPSRPADHYTPHGKYITGTVRAFHEEARAARLTSPAAEAAHSKCAQARFESGVSLDRGVALNGEKSAPRYSRPGSRPGPSGRAMPDTAPGMRTDRSRGAPRFTHAPTAAAHTALGTRKPPEQRRSGGQHKHIPLPVSVPQGTPRRSIPRALLGINNTPTPIRHAPSWVATGAGAGTGPPTPPPHADKANTDKTVAATVRTGRVFIMR